jgi:cyclopropane fatty-acyl-phospholipid synthase-like methyltransferase
MGSLALGVGANTAIFTVAKQVLFDRLAVPHPEQLRLLTWTAPKPSIVHHLWNDPSPGGERTAFISQHIYQGGTSRVYMPKFTEAVTKSRFELLAVHNDRRNYYLTAKTWMERYEQNRDEIREKFGERTYRKFRLYLAGAAYTLNHPSHLATAYRVFLELAA